MFIDKSMTKDVQTIGPEAGILEAQTLMAQNRIRHLPVVNEENTLLGIVTDRDIRSALPSTLLTEVEKVAEEKRLSTLRVKNIMTPHPVTISPAQTLEDAIMLMQKLKVGAFPVVDEEGKLQGIVSVRDLMRAFVNVLGLEEPGMLLGIIVEDKVGQMKRIVDAITEQGISFGSILVARHWEEGKRAVFPYLLTTNISKARKRLVELGFTLINPMEWYLDQMPKK
ncbi:MAG: CBS and ACT domain-containing protein [Desulfobacteraceae bacterium]|nr:CBS and ACT domain-containing protein [Desulfobacteraceae bacterium]